MSVAVLINDVNRPCLKGSVRINYKRGVRSTASFVLIDLDYSYRPEVGDRVRIFSDSTEAWAGIISSFREISFSQRMMTYRRYEVEAVGWEYRLDRRLTYDYPNGIVASYSRNYYFTVDAIENWIIAPGHTCQVGDVVQVAAVPGSALPTPLEDSTDYYVRVADGDKIKLSDQPNGFIIDLEDEGYGWRRLLTLRVGEIVRDLIEKYAGPAWPGQPGEEIIIGQVDDGPIVDRVVFVATTITEALNQLADLSGCRWWITNDRKLYFVSYTGYGTAPFSLTGTSANFRNLEVLRTVESKVNDILAKVSINQIPSSEEIFAGDGQTRTWELQYPVGQIAYVRVNRLATQTGFGCNADQDYLVLDNLSGATEGTRIRILEIVGGAPLTTNKDYYARDIGQYPKNGVEPDPNSMRLAEYPGGPAIDITDVGGGVMVVLMDDMWYDYNFAELESGTDADFYYTVGSNVIRQNPGRLAVEEGKSIAVGYWKLGAEYLQVDDTDNIVQTANKEGGSGRYALLRDYSATRAGQVTAVAMAQAEIDVYKNGGVEVTYETDLAVEPSVLDLQPGQTQSVNLPDFGLNGDFAVEEVSVQDAHGFLVWRVALRMSHRDWVDYYRALVRRQQALAIVPAVGAAKTAAVEEPLPGIVMYTPARYEYGVFTIENVEALSNFHNLMGLYVNLVYIDELTTDVWVTIDTAIDETTDPVEVTVTPNPDRRTPPEVLDFEVGDYVIFNDQGKYECCQIIDISENLWTLRRHYPGTDPGRATFESFMNYHDPGTQIFKLQVREFPFPAPAGKWDDPTGNIPGRFDMPIPAACVVCVVAAVWNRTGYGPWTNYNLSTTELPGLRTHVGGTYSFVVRGDLYVVDQPVPAKLVQLATPIRVAFATVVEAPSGANVEVKVVRIPAGETDWQELFTLAIPDGKTQSWSSDDLDPYLRELPYGGTWPVPWLAPGDQLGINIAQVGGTVPGTDLTVEVAV
jgi:hypothetical protein